MEKELNMATPEIATFVYEGYMLGIMQANGDAYREWMYSNYVQLNCHDDIITDKEVFVAFYGDVAINAPFFKKVKLSWSVLREWKLDLVVFFKKNIDLGCYLYFKVDDYYIPHRYATNNTHYMHDELIMGYDDKNFIVLGYGDDGQCSKQKVPYGQFMEALENNHAVIDKNEWQDDIYFLKYVHYDYKLNLSAICAQLYDFLHSINRKEENSLFKNPLLDTVYGLKVYDRMLLYLNVLMEQGNIFSGGENIDNRMFRIIMEHKKVMWDRIKILNDIYGGLDDLYERYEPVKERAKDIHMMAVKYQITSSKRLLSRLIAGMQYIRDADERILGELLERLETIKQCSVVDLKTDYLMEKAM